MMCSLAADMTWLVHVHTVVSLLLLTITSSSTSVQNAERVDLVQLSQSSVQPLPGVCADFYTACEIINKKKKRFSTGERNVRSHNTLTVIVLCKHNKRRAQPHKKLESFKIQKYKTQQKSPAVSRQTGALLSGADISMQRLGSALGFCRLCHCLGRSRPCLECSKNKKQTAAALHKYTHAHTQAHGWRRGEQPTG